MTFMTHFVTQLPFWSFEISKLLRLFMNVTDHINMPGFVYNVLSYFITRAQQVIDQPMFSVALSPLGSICFQWYYPVEIVPLKTYTTQWR